ncbi:TetR/AcrR family transcriptional regulator [Actinoplanes couchii]|uniref:TetR family transcriptional regulator n=1 Tax=Actinoplanes couchii TaxID=403638 RepID=A0ABQ3XGQ7_9ACTN|nr:TetR/AcrR family transcriptional regulator C-terminal domain-containing protein [Actinoplanes couchii]MDR6320827.1 AcrR family transcriptional regulator [Actinoplanes couchii]GID57688.1 TetR family transcriptional regulator [Actinoplanes couchii]
MRDLMTLLWTPAAPPRRGPRPTLTLETITAAGIAAADAEGLAAVTMQRVAEAVGVTKMALYRYVPGKAELVALMLDTAIGAPPDPVPGATWRATLDGWARALFTGFHAHPWALEAAVGARVIGPNELSWLETAVAALTDSGLHGSEKLDVAVLLTGHVRNLAQQVTAMPPGADPEQAMGLQALLAGREERFPAVAAALESTGGDRALDFGLARILDGVGVLIAERITRPT